MCSQAILRGYYSLLTLVRLNQNIVPQDSNTIMKYVIQDLFITFSPLWSSSDQKTTTCKFTIFKISDYQRRVPSIPKKSSFNVQNFTQYFRVFLLRKIFNIFIDDIIGKPLDLTKYVCPRSGRSVRFMIHTIFLMKCEAYSSSEINANLWTLTGIQQKEFLSEGASAGA